MVPTSLWLALSIAGLSLITEDGATALAAGAAGRVIDIRLAFVSCFLGIWLGDLGLYGAARSRGRQVLTKKFAQRFLPSDKLDRAEQWFRRHGVAALLLSRIVPGSRLPTYVAAGMLKMPFAVFAGVTAVCVAAWVGAALLLAQQVPGSWTTDGSLGGLLATMIAAFSVFLLLATARPMVYRAGRKLRTLWRRYRRWEFWPAWLFYLPVAMMNAWLTVRYRGVALPTVANPSQRNGGLIGESKIEIQAALMKVAPEHVADAYLIPAGNVRQRMSSLETLLEARKIQFPFVLKPDIGQRGAGFRKIGSLRDAEQYLNQVRSAVILQHYAPGPHEAGIFYYRLPNETQGRIFAITEKIFPVVTGDGGSTLRELITSDERASLLADTYFRRFQHMLDVVIPAGKSIRLVEAGNHCQGCVFRNGMHLYSEPLREAIDRISQLLPGFFIGRYDVRYASPEELRRGRGFTIIELNGSASEATNIYDSRNSLWSAYKILYRQWHLVYQIGKMNRERGHRPAKVRSVIVDWYAYQKLAACYPPAD